jgi:alpha-glucoside transport system permease protein
MSAATAAGGVRPGRRRPGLASRWAVRLAVVGVCLVWSIPTLGLLVSSFRSNAEIRSTQWWDALLHPLESEWTLINYQQVLADDNLLNAFLNSVVVTIPAVVIPITMAAFAAYAFAWMRFPGRGVLFAIVVGLIVVPLQMALVPILRIYVEIDLAGTYLGIWLAHAGFGVPLAVYLLYNYISQLPGELFESAAIDGASHFAIFRRLVLPLSLPVIASFAIFQFLWVWNDLLIALVFLGTTEDVQVLPTALNELVGTRGEAWHLLTAGAFVTMVVPIVVFLALQRYFVRGIIAGSVKG